MGGLHELETNDWGDKSARTRLGELESHAISLQQYSHLSIPLLLQAPGYAAAILKHQGSRTVDLGVRQLEVRQRLHARRGTSCAFFLPQSVLNVRIGDTWDEQREHLIAESYEPNTTIRIIPHEQYYNAHPAILVEATAGERQVYLESAIHNSYLSNDKDLLRLTQAMFSRLGEIALDRFESAELILGS